MALLTIGAFARASGLTPKALRLYDDLSLLPPAAVDAESGYRFYDRAQLPRAELIARLRRLGMSLAEIRTVCALRPAAAADAVAAHWDQVTADTADRARLAASLVEQLSGRGTTMSDATSVVALRSAAGCAIGARPSNDDAVHADDRLLAVADGVGRPGGAAASTAAIAALTPLDVTGVPAATALGRVAAAVTEAHHGIRGSADDDGQPFTTLTAMLRAGSQFVLVHVGDSRAYLLRAGELHQLTQDHTLVQSRVDRGQLDPGEAWTHPDRALLVRAVGAGGEEVEVDLALRTALVGDRYLLCSDGLSAVVDRAAVESTLSAGSDPERTVQRLMELAAVEGAPDNVSCVVADVVPAQLPHQPAAGFVQVSS